MTKIVMKAEYLNSLAQQIEQVTAQLQQVDGMLQHALRPHGNRVTGRRSLDYIRRISSVFKVQGKVCSSWLLM